MSHAFFVTSSIELDPTKKFKGTGSRTVFSTEERLAHTIETIQNLYLRDPNAPIWFVDSSERIFNELLDLKIPTFNYVRLQELNPTVADIARTYTSKSHCECVMILEFFKHYKEELKKYDFITKICGRYTFSDNFNLDLYTPENTDKFFMKKELVWRDEHIDFLSPDVLPLDMLVDNTLYGYYTVAHGFGRDKIDQYEAIMTACAQAGVSYSKYYHQDVEYTLYMYLRIFDLLKDVIIVDWTVDGRCGISGDWVRY